MTERRVSDPDGHLDRLQRAEFDGLGRLIRLLDPDGHAAAYEYDANGNRLSLTGADQSHLYTYDSASNRLIGIDARDITLDAAGNTLSDGQGRQFQYNRAGRLHKVHENGTLLAVYHYNAQGQRTRKSVFGQTPEVTVYHYDLDGHLLAETTERGRPLKAYIWLDDRPLAQIQGSGAGGGLGNVHFNRHLTAETDDQDGRIKKVRLDSHLFVHLHAKGWAGWHGKASGQDRIVYLHTDHLDTPRLGTDGRGEIVWRSATATPSATTWTASQAPGTQRQARKVTDTVTLTHSGHATKVAGIMENRRPSRSICAFRGSILTRRRGCITTTSETTILRKGITFKAIRLAFEVGLTHIPMFTIIPCCIPIRVGWLLRKTYRLALT